MTIESLPTADAALSVRDRTWRTRVSAAEASDRRALERDLHDGVGQRLAAIRIKLTLAAERGDCEAAMRGALTELRADLDAAIDELRDIAQGIYPTVLADHGLAAALDAIRCRAAVPVTLRTRGLGRYRPEVESAVYYCCREALQNALKHGGPLVTVTIALEERGRELLFEVADSGPGTGPVREGNGVQNMRDRITALGGRVSVSRGAQLGVVVSGAVSLR